MSQPDDAEGEQDEREPESEESEPAAAEATSGKSKAKLPGRSRGARRQAKPEKRAEKERATAPAQSAAKAIGIGLVAVAIGGAAGWFGHEAQAKAKLSAESAPAPAGSATGPCADWQRQICGKSGDTSATCQQAKGASELLTPTTCEAALQSVPATLAKVKAARATCDDLVGKVCKDLPQGSQTCSMVKERTPSLPADKCKEMLEHYAEVIGELRMMDQQAGQGMGGPGMGGPGMGAPPGAMPPGGPAH